MRLKPCTIIKTVIALMIISALSVYVFFNTRLFIEGPQIVVEGPENGFSGDSGLVEVYGQVLNSSFISLNGRAVLVDENSNFKELVMLHPGYNIIVIEANDKFDRKVTRQLDLVYNPGEDGIFDYDSGESEIFDYKSSVLNDDEGGGPVTEDSTI